jgi:hypothetical protein
LETGTDGTTCSGGSLVLIVVMGEALTPPPCSAPSPGRFLDFREKRLLVFESTPILTNCNRDVDGCLSVSDQKSRIAIL